MSSIVIYYSRNGSTAIAAKHIAEKFNADIVELKEKKPRRGFLVSGYRSAAGKRPELAGDPWLSMDGKDLIILGAPIWAGNGNPVLNSFLDKADFTGKKIILFTLQADPELGSSEKVLNLMSERIVGSGGTLVAARGFHGQSPGKTAEAEYVRSQLDTWEIPGI